MDQQQETRRFSARALARVMDELSDPNAVFTLQVSDGANEKVIHFTGGTIRLLSLGERSLGGLESQLLESRRLDVDTLHEVLELVRNGRTSLREALVGKHVIGDEEYEQIINRLLRDEILDLVFWDGADFTCSTGLPPPEILTQDDRVLIGTPSWPELTKAVGRWISEWESLKRTLHSDRARVSPTRKGLYAIEKLDGDKKRCLEACLKSRNLRAVWKTSALDLPAVGTTVEHFRQKGWIEIQPPSRKEEPLEETIERLEEALPRVVGKDLVREKLLRLYRKAKLTDKAAGMLEELGASALESSRWSLAIERWKKLLSLSPGRLDVLERVVEVYLDQEMNREAVATAREHARKLLEGKSLEEACAVAKIIENRVGSRPEAAAIIAAAGALGGDVDGAVEQYLSVARELADEDDEKEAARMLRRALSYCGEHTPLLEYLQTLEQSAGSRWSSEGQDDRSAPSSRSGESRGGPALAISLGTFALVVAVVLHLSGALSFAFREMAEFARQHGTEENAFGERIDPPLARFFETLADLTGTGAEAGSYKDDDDPDGNTSRIEESSWDEDEESDPPDFLSSWKGFLEEPAGKERQGPSSEPSGNGTASPRGSRRLDRDGEKPRDIPDANRIVSLTKGLASELSRKGSRVAGNEGSTKESRWGIGLGEEQIPSDWKPSASAAPVVSARLISRAARMMCGHTPPHPPRLRLAARGVFLAWSDSCNLAAVDPATGEILFYVEGAPGHRWAIGYRGTMVCCWRPGKTGVLYNARGRTKDFTPWAFPADTEAVAIGDEMLAVRQAVRTTLYRLDGTPLHAGELLIWDEGVFIDTALILTRSSEDPRGPRGTWALRTPTLEPLWCVIDREGRLEVR